MKLIYIAGPYRARTTNEVRQNIRAAEERALDAVRAGHYPIVPHLCTGFMDGAAPDQQFLDGSLEALRRCDEVWLIDGWRDSQGTLQEVFTALALGIPVKDEHGNREHWPATRSERRQEKEGRPEIERTETGVYQPSPDDWPGIFIRGDQAFQFASALEGANIVARHQIALSYVEELISLLKSCRQGPTTDRDPGDEAVRS